MDQEKPKGIKDPAHKAHTIAAFVVLALFCLLLGAGIWYYLDSSSQDNSSWTSLTGKGKKKTEKPATTTTTPTDETANWKTYNDPTLSYLYKYPGTWDFITGKGISNHTIFKDDNNYISINAINNIYSKTPEAYYSEVIQQITSNTTPGSSVFSGGKNNQSINLGDNKVVVFDYTLPAGQVWKVYLLSSSKTLIEVVVVGDANLIKTAETIISTLKFN